MTSGMTRVKMCMWVETSARFANFERNRQLLTHYVGELVIGRGGCTDGVGAAWSNHVSAVCICKSDDAEFQAGWK